MKFAILVVSALGLLAASGQAQQMRAAYTNPNPPAAGHVPASPEGAVLWDQMATAPFAYVDQVFTDYGTYDTFQVNDVSVPVGSAWNVTTVTTSYTVTTGAWSPITITSANLQVFPKVGPLPVDATDLVPEYTVPATLTLSGATWLLSADTSTVPELQCISGDFWIGLTPITTFLVHGQEFHWRAAALVGDDTAYRNPGGAFLLGPDWGSLADFDVPVTAGPPYESTILLEGDVLLPTWSPFPGTGLPGLFGPVVSVNDGVPCPGQIVSLDVFGLTEDFPVPSLGSLFIGLTPLFAPFKGGVFVPTPDTLLIIPLDAVGDGGVSGAWPTGIPAGTPIHMQWWTKGLFGFAASDGFVVTAL